MKILIVDDEPDIVEVLEIAFALKWPDATIVAAGAGAKAIAAARAEAPDLILLDIGLPDLDGFQVCQAIRRFSDAPIIMLTARGEPLDKIKGLELGADDYITKPFEHRELIARVQATLRRAQEEDRASRSIVEAGPISIDLQTKQASAHGKAIALSPAEFRLLYYLAQSAGQTLSYHTLLSKIWGQERAGQVDYLRACVNQLRQKLAGAAVHPTIISEESGAGYRLRA